MQNIIKGMFFDLDGTLCDTDEANFQAYTSALADEGYKITKDDFYKTIGLSSDAFIPMLAPGIKNEAVERVKASKVKYYAEVMHLVKPNRKLINFLEFMKPQHTLGLVTTAKRKNAMRVLESVGLDSVFDFMIFGDEVEQAKPHPEVYFKALEISGLKNDEVIAFEDSQPGMQAAAAAGIKIIRIVIDEN